MGCHARPFAYVVKGRTTLPASELLATELGPDLERWIAQAQAGDARAFNRLVEHFQASAFHLAVYHTGHVDDARDACQEAMLKAWQAVPRFRGNARAFRSWLFRIVINAAIDWRRRRQRRTAEPLEHQADGRPRVLPDPGETPERYAERHDLRALLAYTMLQLSEEHRSVLLLGQAGFDYAEIAATLEIEVGTVKSRMSRARVQLRQILLGGEGRPAAMEPAGSEERLMDGPAAPWAGPSERQDRSA